MKAALVRIVRLSVCALVPFALALPASAQALEKEIGEVQQGHISPFEGQPVILRDNIVTAVGDNFFFLQTPDARADNDPTTSEGIRVFVRLSSNQDLAVAVGDTVTVQGVVTEEPPGGAASNLTTTEITVTNQQQNIQVTASGTALPVPVVIGAGGRVPPPQIIDDDSAGTVGAATDYDPASDGIDFYESLEAMRVQVNGAVVTGPTNQFGEIWVVGDAGASATTLTGRGGVIITAGDFNPERIQLDDDLYPGVWHSLNVGDRFSRPIVGVLDYNFGNFELLVTEPVSVLSGGLLPETTTLHVAPDALTVATYNVENLGGNDPQAAFDARAAQIVGNLGSPAILVLEEIQDNNGAPVRPGGGDTDTDAALTYNRLIQSILNAGGPRYSFRQINPESNTDGGEPGGNIRQGFLFRSDMGVGFTDRAGGDATTAVSVECQPNSVQIDTNPGRIEPENAAFDDSRKPLVGEFQFNGETLFVIAVHFNSKGGDNSLFGARQPPVLNSEAQRLQQAAIVHDFALSILACDPDANILIAGDVNDFDFSPVAQALQGNILTNMVELLPPNERYSYVYEGNSQLLDQIYMSANLLDEHAPQYDIVHVNAEFAAQVSDHDPSVALFQFALP